MPPKCISKKSEDEKTPPLGGSLQQSLPPDDPADDKEADTTHDPGDEMNDKADDSANTSELGEEARADVGVPQSSDRSTPTESTDEKEPPSCASVDDSGSSEDELHAPLFPDGRSLVRRETSFQADVGVPQTSDKSTELTNVPVDPHLPRDEPLKDDDPNDFLPLMEEHSTQSGHHQLPLSHVSDDPLAIGHSQPQNAEADNQQSDEDEYSSEEYLDDEIYHLSEEELDSMMEDNTEENVGEENKFLVREGSQLDNQGENAIAGFVGLKSFGPKDSDTKSEGSKFLEPEGSDPKSDGSKSPDSEGSDSKSEESKSLEESDSKSNGSKSPEHEGSDSRSEGSKSPKDSDDDSSEAPSPSRPDPRPEPRIEVRRRDVIPVEDMILRLNVEDDRGAERFNAAVPYDAANIRNVLVPMAAPDNQGILVPYVHPGRRRIFVHLESITLRHSEFVVTNVKMCERYSSLLQNLTDGWARRTVDFGGPFRTYLDHCTAVYFQMAEREDPGLPEAGYQLHLIEDALMNCDMIIHRNRYILEYVASYSDWIKDMYQNYVFTGRNIEAYNFFPERFEELNKYLDEAQGNMYLYRNDAETINEFMVVLEPLFGLPQ